MELRSPQWSRSRLLFELSPQQVSSGLQGLLRDLGMSPSEASTFTTHAFRRGAGTDVLEAETVSCHLLGVARWQTTGAYRVPGMLRMGEWAGKSSASHYATIDEQNCATMAFSMMEASDDEDEANVAFTSVKRAKGSQGLSNRGTLRPLEVKSEAKHE